MPIKAQAYRANLYEQALLLADARSRKNEVDSRWAAFIENLSRICDEFAHSISNDQKRLD